MNLELVVACLPFGLQTRQYKDDGETRFMVGYNHWGYHGVCGPSGYGFTEAEFCEVFSQNLESLHYFVFGPF